jgi:RNA 2',3'-cyclic 3'-phosphodiesterase
MRLFVGIDLPAEVKESLRAFVRPLKPLAKINWSPIENLHITTKFIGEWPEPRLEEMKQVLASLPKLGAIDIRVDGVGWFPNERRPRVFWAGIEAGEQLRTLANSTEQAVAVLGVPVEERQFSPHLTLARIRETVPLGALQKSLQDLRHNFGSFQAREFFLYLSAGGKYTKLGQFSLL